MTLPPELQAALLGRRVVFLRGRLDDSSANNAIAQLLLAGRAAPGQSIELYLDSPGGSLSGALSVYDVMQTLGSPVSTTCTGTAGGAAVIVLAGGAGGRRLVLPHARVRLFEEEMEVVSADARAGAGCAEEVSRQRQRWLAVLAQHTAHSTIQLARDLSAGRWLSAAEACDYGLVDGISQGQPGPVY